MSQLLRLFLVCVLVATFSIGSKAEAGTVNITDVNLTLKEHVLQTAFAIENNLEIQQNAIYGIRLQASDGDSVYETPVGEVILRAGESRVEYATIDLPITMLGTKDVFLISRDSQGLVISLKYAGKVDIKKNVSKVSGQPNVSSNLYSPAVLDNCKLIKDNTSIKCGITDSSNKSVNIKYNFHKGSMYTPVFKEGAFNNIEVMGSEVDIPIIDDLPSGVYTYRLWISNKNLATNIIVNVDNGDIVEDEILKGGEGANGEGLNNGLSTYNYAKAAIIVVPIFALIVLLYIALRRPRALVVVIIGTGLVLSGVAIAAVTLTDTNGAVHIFSGVSQDSGDEQFLVTLDNNNAEFQTVEQVGFSIVFQNSALPNDKPLDGSVDVRVDNASWQSLILSSDSGTIYYETLPPINAVGTHTLNFRSPDLCGGVFGFSLFDFGIFGTTECLFSIPITIVLNDPPTTPTIGGNCVLGESCSLGIESTDTDGGQLCYEADWPTGPNTNAGCAIEGNPVSVSYTFNSCDATETTVRAQATDGSGETSAWGVGASDVPNSITCIEPCTHCTYNGTEGALSIKAQPPFLPPSGIVNISWDLTNVATCSMASSDINTGAPRGGPWDWDFVRLNSNMDTVVLDSATKYTITCTDLNGAQESSSVTVTEVPAWQEF